MKHIRLFSVLILCSLFSIQTYSQGCNYGPPSISYSNSGNGLFSFTNSYYIPGSTVYSWSFGDGSTSALSSPTYTYSADGFYTVTVNITYEINLGVYGILICNTDASINIMVNNTNSAYGCMDTSALNYNPSVTIDDGSCILGATWATLQMNDSYGDGWNGDTWSAISTSGASGHGPFSLGSGSSASQSFLLLDDCYDIICDFGLYPYETTWSLIDNNGTTLVSGGSPYNSNLCTYPTVPGCTDATACNFDASANTDDGSCNYNSSSYDTLISNINIVWNGMTLIASGDYSVILANVVGCDSIANLSLSIINTTGVENVYGHNKVLIKITDILGKETPYRRNTPLFYIYNDGTVERKLIIK